MIQLATTDHGALPRLRSYRGWTTIENNSAWENGGAMSIMDDGSTGSSVEFTQPTKVRSSGNTKTGVSGVHVAWMLAGIRVALHAEGPPWRASNANCSGLVTCP